MPAHKGEMTADESRHVQTRKNRKSHQSTHCWHWFCGVRRVSQLATDRRPIIECDQPIFFTSYGIKFYFWHEPAELAHSFLFRSSVCFGLYCPFNCISFHKFSRQLSAFSLCSSGLISALLVLSTMYLFMKASLSPDIIPCGWLGLKHQLTN